MTIHGLGSHSVMDALSQSKFEFHLTGSRYFGNSTAESDYDFYADYTADGIRPFLKSLGFVAQRKYDGLAQYHDVNIAEVWQHKIANIHIQLQKDMAMKKYAQQVMKIFYPSWVTVAKAQRHHWWNRAYMVAKLEIPKP